jgi:putative transcriptional regulator
MDSLARMAERSILAGFRWNGSTFRHIAIYGPMERLRLQTSVPEKTGNFQSEIAGPSGLVSCCLCGLEKNTNRHAQKMESLLDKAQALRYAELESWLYMGRAIINRVKELRAARGWTQEQLAQAAGVSRQSINSIERNRYVPSLERALVFVRLFNCPIDQIFQLENDK